MTMTESVSDIAQSHVEFVVVEAASSSSLKVKKSSCNIIIVQNFNLEHREFDIILTFL